MNFEMVSDSKRCPVSALNPCPSVLLLLIEQVGIVFVSINQSQHCRPIEGETTAWERSPVLWPSGPQCWEIGADTTSPRASPPAMYFLTDCSCVLCAMWWPRIEVSLKTAVFSLKLRSAVHYTKNMLEFWHKLSNSGAAQKQVLVRPLYFVVLLFHFFFIFYPSDFG